MSRADSPQAKRLPDKYKDQSTNQDFGPREDEHIKHAFKSSDKAEETTEEKGPSGKWGSGWN